MARLDMELDAQELDARELDALLEDLTAAVSELDQLEADVDAFAATL